MSTSDRGGALARRRTRIAGHLRAGKTPGEICDIEGLDTANEPKRMKKEVADPEGLAIPHGKNTAPPVGMLEIPRNMLYNLGKIVKKLRDEHSYVDVSQMIGLTNAEQLRSVESPWRHNWTVSQMMRLATASGLTFAELLVEMQKPFEADVTRWKLT